MEVQGEAAAAAGEVAPAAAQGLRRSWWRRPTPDEVHEAALQQAAQEDFADLDKLGFLQVVGRDRRDRPIVQVAARLYLPTVVSKERTFRYVVHKLDAASQEPFVLVWLHTGATYLANCPSAWWLWSTYEGLPKRYRDNLAQVHVVHCDLSLHTTINVALPWWSGNLWHKVNIVPRVEFLWDAMDQRVVLPHLPEYVLEHDAELEEAPLQDYGVVVPRELATALPGAPQPTL